MYLFGMGVCGHVTVLYAVLDTAWHCSHLLGMSFGLVVLYI